MMTLLRFDQGDTLEIVRSDACVTLKANGTWVCDYTGHDDVYGRVCSHFGAAEGSGPVVMKYPKTFELCVDRLIQHTERVS